MRQTALAVATLAFALPGLAPVAAAQEDTALTFSGSVTLTSRYMSDGVAYSDGVALQSYVEMGYGGLYAGVWATTATEALLGSDAEVDFYLGYRGEAGVFYYDIGYGYYTYPGASAFNSGEVLVSGGAGLSESLYLTAYLAYSPEFETLDRSLRVDWYTPVEGLALAATAGDNESWRYWTLGGSYALSDRLTADLTWHDTDIAGTNGRLVGGITLSF